MDDEAKAAPALVGQVEPGVGRPVPERCAIMHGYDTLGAEDREGCVLPDGHDGPHEFVAPDGSHWQWETDMECACAHCMRCDGDYCTVYWRKQYRETPNVPMS